MVCNYELSNAFSAATVLNKCRLPLRYRVVNIDYVMYASRVNVSLSCFGGLQQRLHMWGFCDAQQEQNRLQYFIRFLVRPVANCRSSFSAIASKYSTEVSPRLLSAALSNRFNYTFTYSLFG